MENAPARPLEEQLDREFRLVREAVALVALGGSPRVTVAGLALGETLLDAARSIARDAGVRLVPRWGIGESGLDLTVERAAG